METVIVDKVTKAYKLVDHQTGGLAYFRHLLKPTYREFRAVDEISFSIKEGEFVGYLGPNGAGKSTMMKMLTGTLIPTHGTISVLGRVPSEQRIPHTKAIGVVFGQRSQLWWDLPVRESFDLRRIIYDVQNREYNQNLEMVVASLGLTSFLDRPVRLLSLGQRMRAELAAALLHGPRVLLLDEPTIGLDVLAKDTLRKCLLDLNRNHQVTILLTTHDMRDIELLCTRLIMVDHGRVLFDGTAKELRSGLGLKRRLMLSFSEDPGEIHIPDTEAICKTGETRSFIVQDDQRSMIEIISALPVGAKLRDASLDQPDIEEVVKDFYSRSA